MAAPFFSIIIPTLNEEKFLPLLLTSLEKQTDQDFEVFVADGESKDHTVAVAKTYASKFKLTVMVGKKPGVSSQRNLGADHANAEWLVFADADTILLPTFVEDSKKYVTAHHPSFFTTWFRGDRSDFSGVAMGILGTILVELSLLIQRPWAPGPLTIIKKDAFKKVGGYDEDATFGEDHDLAMKVFDTGIGLQILRKVEFMYSMRRYRYEGILPTFRRYFQSGLSVILTRHGPKHIAGFVAGGQLYTQKK